jgi:hypothetical protein
MVPLIILGALNEHIVILFGANIVFFLKYAGADETSVLGTAWCCWLAWCRHEGYFLSIYPDPLSGFVRFRFAFGRVPIFLSDGSASESCFASSELKVDLLIQLSHDLRAGSHLCRLDLGYG